MQGYIADSEAQAHTEIWENYQQRIVIEKFREIIRSHENCLVENLCDLRHRDPYSLNIWALQSELHDDLENLFKTWISNDDYMVVKRLFSVSNNGFWYNNYSSEINKIINNFLCEQDKIVSKRYEEINSIVDPLDNIQTRMERMNV